MPRRHAHSPAPRSSAWGTLLIPFALASLGGCKRPVPVKAEVTAVRRDGAIVRVDTAPGATVRITGRSEIADASGKVTMTLPMSELSSWFKVMDPSGSSIGPLRLHVEASRSSILGRSEGSDSLTLAWSPERFGRASGSEPFVLAPYVGSCFDVEAEGRAELSTGDEVAVSTVGPASVTIGGVTFRTGADGFGTWRPFPATVPDEILGRRRALDVDVDVGRGSQKVAQLMFSLNRRGECAYRVAEMVDKAVREKSAWPFAPRAAPTGGRGARAPVLVIRDAKVPGDRLHMPGRTGPLYANDTPVGAARYVAIEHATGRRPTERRCHGVDREKRSGSAKLVAVDTEIALYTLPGYARLATIPLQGGDGGCPEYYVDGEEIADYAADATVLEAVWAKLPLQ